MAKDYLKVVQTWLDGNFDEDTKAKIRELQAKDPVGLEDAFYRNLEFGTGGLRGIMGVGTNRINKYTIGMATQGLANYLKKSCKGELKVCISYDSRNNSQEYAKIAANVLAANGINVYIFDELRPIALMSYSVRAKKANAGIMITASHNPKEYNGYKVFWSDGAQVLSPIDKEIVEEVNKITDPSLVKFDLGPGAGKIETMGVEMDEAYLKSVTGLMLSPEARAKHSDLKIVYTPIHGSGVNIIPKFFERIGFKNVIHVPEQDVLDGNFPTVPSPNPEDAAALALALEKAEKEGADIVMGTDPDADRLGVAVRDNKGKLVLLTGNQTASILTYYVLRRWHELGKLDETKYCVKTIVTTELMTAICKKYNVKLYNVLTGFKYIADIIKNNEGKGEFICGGEESYGFNIGEFVRDKDAPISCAMMAEAAAWAKEQGKTLYQVLHDIYAEFGYYKESLLSLTRKGKAGVEEIAKIMSDYRANPPKEIAGSPVVKVLDYKKPEETGLPSSNVLQFYNKAGDLVTIRPSGTEPKIKFYFSTFGPDADAKVAQLEAQFK